MKNPDSQTDLAALRDKIENRAAKLAVIGLGYVGLPVAASFAQAGYSVTGVDIDESVVSTVLSGNAPERGDEPGLAKLIEDNVQNGRLVATDSYSDISDHDIFLLCVDTPVGQDNLPKYGSLRAASMSLASVLPKGSLVINESTVAPGTTQNVLGATISSVSGMIVGTDFFLGVCPERVMPGKMLANLKEISRVCGGDTPEVAGVMKTLYATVVAAEIDITDIRTAEFVKTAENTYRDVQIAFANELALIAQDVGVDFWEARDLINKVPYRDVHLAGGGVGGHCIPKDPWLLVSSLSDYLPTLVTAARNLNSAMPAKVAEMAKSALGGQAAELSGAKIVILGYSYLPNSNDTRNSPSAELVKILESQGAVVSIIDPHVPSIDSPITSAFQNADLAILMVAHDAFAKLDWHLLATQMTRKIAIDARNFLQKDSLEQAGVALYSLGRPQYDQPAAITD